MEKVVRHCENLLRAGNEMSEDFKERSLLSENGRTILLVQRQHRLQIGAGPFADPAFRDPEPLASICGSASVLRYRAAFHVEQKRV